MELDAPTAAAYVGHAFGQMLAAADRLGDELVNVRPYGPTTNSVAALVVHCCGLTEWWLGHVALGEPSDRDRTAEFRHEATVAELHEHVDATLARAGDLLARLDVGDGLPGHPARESLPGDSETDAAVVLHVLEEIYQHLGHVQLTVDALVLR
jgi:hypothetical protein